MKTLAAILMLIASAAAASAQHTAQGWRFPAPGWTPIVDVSEGKVWFNLGDGFSAAFDGNDKAVVRLPQQGKPSTGGVFLRWGLSNSVITHTFALDDALARAPQANLAIEYAAPVSRVVFDYVVLDWASQKCTARVSVADDFKTASITLRCLPPRAGWMAVPNPPAHASPTLNS